MSSRLRTSRSRRSSTPKRRGSKKNIKSATPLHTRPLLDLGPTLPPPLPFENLLECLLKNEVRPECELYGLTLTRHALKNLTPQEIRDLKFVFDTFSRDQQCLDFISLKRSVRMLGFNVTDQELWSMLKDYASAKEDRLTLNEFLHLVGDLQGDGYDFYGEIMNTFDMVAVDGLKASGEEASQAGEGEPVLSPERLRGVCEQLGIDLTPHELDEMILLADRNGDGVVDRDEFIAVMQGSALFR